MRPILALNGVLFVIALVLFAIDMWCDRNSLLGANVKEKTLLGRRMEELLDMQPVIPNRFIIFKDSNLIGFIYEQEDSFWHKYPFVEVVLVNERVFCADVRN